MANFVFIKSTAEGSKIEKCEVKEINGSNIVLWWGFTETLNYDTETGSIVYNRSPNYKFIISSEEEYEIQEKEENAMWDRYYVAVKNFGITSSSRTAKGKQRALWDKFEELYPTIEDAANSVIS